MLQDDPTFRDPEFPGAWVLDLPGTIYWQPPCHQDIYGLVDTRTHLVRYIGRSRNAQLRHREHLRPGNRSGQNRSEAKHTWLDELARLELEPTIDILETIEPFEPTDGYYSDIQATTSYLSDDRGELRGVRKYDRYMNRFQIYVNEREQRWILYGVQNCWPLTNAGVQIRKDGIFTEAFVDTLRQNRALDILYEPLESPAWSVLVPTCPKSVFKDTYEERAARRRARLASRIDQWHRARQIDGDAGASAGGRKD